MAYVDGIIAPKASVVKSFMEKKKKFAELKSE
jgi:hypothetical protein